MIFFACMCISNLTRLKWSALSSADHFEFPFGSFHAKKASKVPSTLDFSSLHIKRTTICQICLPPCLQSYVQSIARCSASSPLDLYPRTLALLYNHESVTPLPRNQTHQSNRQSNFYSTSRRKECMLRCWKDITQA